MFFIVQKQLLRIKRFDPDAQPNSWFQDYKVETAHGMTVLEALTQIQRNMDGTLAFRCACRGAVCGSCAMVINGQVDLACRVQVLSLKQSPVTVEPLHNFRVLKDLIVDMEPFFTKNLEVKPWLDPGDSALRAEQQQQQPQIIMPDDWNEAQPYANCILCGCCYAVCPAAERDPAYLGPAALAKHYRFLTDPRDGVRARRLHLVDGANGVWGCDMVWNCVKICPKHVPPTRGIGKTRALIKRGRND